MIRIKHFIFFALLLQAKWLLGDQIKTTDYPTGEFWRDPVFVKQFLGAYGIKSEIEPKISRKEHDFLQTLVDVMADDTAAAAKKLADALTADSSAAFDFILGNLFLQLDSLDEAEGHYNEAIQKFPSFMRAHNNKGLVHARKGEFDQSLSSLTQAVELGGGDGNTYGLIGYGYFQKGRFLSAEAAYRQAIMFQPDNTNWKVGIAACLLNQRRYPEAAALFGELVADHPHRPDYWLQQANAFIGLNDPIGAAQNYEIVRRMGKATAESLMALGDIYLNQDLGDLAIEAYLQSLKTTPAPSISRPIRAAELLVRRHDYEEAAQIIHEISQIYDGKIEPEEELTLWRLNASISLARGMEDEALDTLEQITNKNPMDGESHLLLARAYAGKGETERAELALERAARIQDFAAPAYRQQGELLVNNGRFREALQYLYQAQKISPQKHISRYIEQVERLAGMQDN